MCVCENTGVEPVTHFVFAAELTLFTLCFDLGHSPYETGLGCELLETRKETPRGPRGLRCPDVPYEESLW